MLASDLWPELDNYAQLDSPPSPPQEQGNAKWEDKMNASQERAAVFSVSLEAISLMA